uniref:Ig-like domain-containing protein n=1 Tax=Poecilia latipinna TaxID=48699 RepID=A0A3B3VIJ8_9TELE
WPVVFRGETVTLRCEIQGGGGTQWKYEWFPANRNSPSSSEYRISSVSDSDGRNYCCKAHSDHQITNWSSAFRLTVDGKSVNFPQFLIFSLTQSYFIKTFFSWNHQLRFKPTPSLTAKNYNIPAGGSVALSCSVRGSAGWRFDWFRQESVHHSAQSIRNNESSGTISVSNEGVYSCRGGRGDPVFYTETSSEVTIQKTVPITPTVIQQPNWSQIYRGEKVTLRCEIQGGTQWTYEWRTTNRNSPSSSEYRITADSSGDYGCRGRRDRFTLTEWRVIRLNVPDRVQHVIDQPVTLKCSGNDTKWRVRRFTETTSPSHVQCSNWGTMHGSSCTINRLWYHSGVYWCESESGEFSNAVNITVQDDYDGIILLSPVHPVTEGDPVTLSCRDKKQQLLSNVFFYHNDKLIQNDSREELNISAVSKSDEGFYKCQHSGKDSPRSWMSVRDAALYESVKPSEATAAEPREITYAIIKFKKLRKKSEFQTRTLRNRRR